MIALLYAASALRSTARLCAIKSAQNLPYGAGRECTTAGLLHVPNWGHHLVIAPFFSIQLIYQRHHRARPYRRCALSGQVFTASTIYVNAFVLGDGDFSGSLLVPASLQPTLGQ
jgi:hypothetical protein